MLPPLLDSSKPIAIISAPNPTVQRTPIRSAIGPIASPPIAEPSHASAYDSAGTDRILPNSAAIDFSATMVIIGAPNEMERTASALTATTHDRPVSIVSDLLVRPSAD